MKMRRVRRLKTNDMQEFARKSGHKQSDSVTFAELWVMPYLIELYLHFRAGSGEPLS